MNVRANFVEYLHGLRDGISRGQLDAVKSLYGERYTQGLLGVERVATEQERAAACSEEEDDSED